MQNQVGVIRGVGSCRCTAAMQTQDPRLRRVISFSAVAAPVSQSVAQQSHEHVLLTQWLPDTVDVRAITGACSHVEWNKQK